jgi:hypothetical protein
MSNSKTLFSIDLRGLTEVEHRQVANDLRRYCPGVLVSEEDQRHTRAIDRQQFQIALASISATCAVIGLIITAHDKLTAHSRVSDHDTEVAELVAQVETKCGLKLDEATVDQLKRCSFDGQRDDRIKLTVGRVGYEITVFKHEKVHIRGKPTPTNSTP